MIGGVCGGIGRYFGVDPTLVRIGFVALVLLGGTGLVVYAATLLLVPLDDEAAAAASTPRDRTAAIGMLVLFVIARVVVGGVGLAAGGALVPIAFLALAGLAVWWLVSGERPSGSPGTMRATRCAGHRTADRLRRPRRRELLRERPGRRARRRRPRDRRRRGARRGRLRRRRALADPAGDRDRVAARVRLRCRDRPQRRLRRAPRASHDARRARPTAIASGRASWSSTCAISKLPAGDHPLSVDVGAGHALVLVPDDVCVCQHGLDRHGRRRRLRARQRRDRHGMERRAPRAGRNGAARDRQRPRARVARDPPSRGWRRFHRAG